MSRGIILGALALLVLVVAAPTQAASLRMHGGGSVPPAEFCPEDLTDPGSVCANSPGGSWQVADFYTTYTGETIAARPPYAAAGVDFPNGVPTTARFATDPLIGGEICTVASLVDPAVATKTGSNDPGCGKMPQACDYVASVVSSQLTAPQIECASTSDNIVMRGLNLGPVGGHLSTYVFIDSSVTGNTTFAFNKYQADESTYVRNGFGSWESGSTGDILFYANTQLGDWEDSWSAQGVGTATQSGTTMTVTACSVCEFRIGQYVDYTGSNVSNNAIYAQLTGTGGAACPDPTCNGGVGTYQMSQSATRGSQAANSGFKMAGGMGCNTSGDVVFTYNAFYQINGRVGTCSQRGTGGAATNIGLISNRANFAQSCVYISDISHYEMLEYVIQDGNRPIQWDKVTNNDNVHYYPPACAAGSLTGTNFISTGAINGTIDPAFTTTYADVESKRNSVVASSSNSLQGAALDYISGGGSGTPVYIGLYTAKDNYIFKGSATYFALGNAQQGSGVSSFFTASQTGTTMTVTAFTGGKAITVGDRVWETGVKITGLGTGTGGTGTYTMETSCSVSCGSGNRRSGPDVITTVDISGNVDMSSGSTLTTPQYLSSQTNASPFLYPGMR